MGWTSYTLELIKRVPGVELLCWIHNVVVSQEPMVSKENYGVSQGIGAGLFRQIEESGAIW